MLFIYHLGCAEMPNGDFRVHPPIPSFMITQKMSALKIFAELIGDPQQQTLPPRPVLLHPTPDALPHRPRGRNRLPSQGTKYQFRAQQQWKDSTYECDHQGLAAFVQASSIPYTTMILSSSPRADFDGPTRPYMPLTVLKLLWD